MNKEELLTASLRDLFTRMAWLNNLEMKDSLKGYKPSEVHCIEYIGKNADSNVTRLAEAFYMTRGAISKMTKKLMKKGLVESYGKPDNRKEVYFRLTERGKAVGEIHEKLHGEFRERDKAVFEGVSDEQFDAMISFAQKYIDHLDAEIKKLGADATGGNDPE